MNDKLREALAIVEKYGMKGDVIYKEIEALAASKPEPQAQAGEPEVVATVESTGEHNFPRLQWVSADHSFRVNIGDKLITLQSHCEARAKLQAERDACEKQADYWQNEAANFAVAIAKKDAALDACVEALENIKSDYAAHDGKRWDIDDAITQAKEARK